MDALTEKSKTVYLRVPSGKNAQECPPAGSSGFTLVEILVVIVIAGIGLSIAVSNLFVSDEERVRHEAERMMALIEKTRDRAAFSGYAIAMRLSEKGIEFLERDPNSIETKWIEASGAGLQPRAWRDGVTASLSLSPTNAASRRAGDPQVVTFLPAGIGVPFALRVSSITHQRVIVGDALGNMSFASGIEATK